MPQTLCVEGPNRDRLIAEIFATYGQGTTITECTAERRGGVLGFFAQEVIRVFFQPPDIQPPDIASAVPLAAPRAGLGRHRALDDDDDAPPPEIAGLLARADSADGPSPVVSTPPLPPPSAIRTPIADEFADLLEKLTAASSAQAATSAASQLPPVQSAPPVPPLAPPYIPRPPAPVPAGRSHATDRAMPRPGVDVRGRLELLTKLRAVGVPVANNPDPHEVSLYRAIEQIVDELPLAAPLPSKAGDVVVVVGAPDQVEPAAALIASRLHISPDAVWRSGPSGGHVRTIAGPTDAVTRLPFLREAATPNVVVIELEIGRDEARFGWAPQLVAALQPDAVWAAVDAGRKVEDLRAELGSLGLIDALVVTGASRTATPATVWDLDIPVAVLDGRPATAGTWAGLLFDALRVEA